jgi:hypothetical protein
MISTTAQLPASNHHHEKVIRLKIICVGLCQDSEWQEVTPTWKEFLEKQRRFNLSQIFPPPFLQPKHSPSLTKTQKNVFFEI